MSDLPPANWYPDPEAPGQQRYWDGTRWTEHRAPLEGGQPAAGDAPQPPQPQWDAAAAPGTAAGRPGTNGLAIASLVVAVLSFLAAFVAVGALGGVLAVVLGVVALRQVRDAAGAQAGRGLAIGGIAVGGVAILVGVVVLAFFAAVTTAIQEGDVGSYVDCVTRQLEQGGDPADC